MTRIRCRRGDTWQQEAEIKLAGGTLAGSAIWLTVKRDARDPDPGLVQISTEAGGIEILDAAAQLVRFRIEAERTAQLPIGDWQFDVQVRLPTGEIQTAENTPGTFSVLPDITRTT